MLGLIPTPPQDAYHEPLRPQFHFTAMNGWLNDPNGLVFFKGEYHLFFQHNPSGTQWGNMTWGHAVSKDLVHWKQVENALEPDSLGTMFSGSGIVDTRGTGGLGNGAMVLFYTAAGGTNEASKGKPFTQCMAWSLDGRTFTKFQGNPVVANEAEGNRDPKVVWHSPTKRWIMALYLTGNKYALYGSGDLQSWSKLSEVDMPGTSECPDFFELPVDGDKGRKMWVFWGANGNYRLGSFDGKNFKPITAVQQSNFGSHCYAAQTYFNDPKGRRTQVFWMNGSEFPNCSWNQQMGFPRVITLRSTALGAQLAFAPMPEIASLRLRKVRGESGKRDTLSDSFEVPSGLADIDLVARTLSAGKLTVGLFGHDLSYDATSSTLSFADKSAKVVLNKGLLHLRILVDLTSVEVFAQDGLITMPCFVLPKEGASSVTVQASPEWRKEKLDVFELRSAWK